MTTTENEINIKQITEGKNKLRAKIVALEQKLDGLHSEQMQIAEKLHLVSDISELASKMIDQSIVLANLLLKLMEKMK